MTNADAARVFGVTVSTISSWTRDGLSGPSAHFAAFLIAASIPPHVVAQHLNLPHINRSREKFEANRIDRKARGDDGRPGEILEFIRSSGGTTHRDLRRRFQRMSAPDFDFVVNQLWRDDCISKTRVAGEKGGRPSVRYCCNS